MSKQRMKKVFDQESLPMTFYAHMMKFVERNCYDQRCAVVFEAVPKDGVSMFVTGEFPFRISQAEDDGGLLTKLWTDFQRGGLEDPAFMADKAGYLGKVANAEIVTMSRSFARAKSIANAKNDWWEITVYQAALSEGEDACLLAIPGYEEIKEELAFAIRPVSAEEEERLYHLYTRYDLLELGKGKNGGMGAIGPGTVFGKVQVLYVGAGLCCCLEDAGGNVIGYFDMGTENPMSKYVLRMNNPVGYPAMNQKSVQSYNAVLRDARNVQGLAVIISHWHTDHVQILNDMAVAYLQNNAFASFWQTAGFVLPDIITAAGWAVTHFTNVVAAILQAGNQNLIIGFYQDQNQNILVYQAQNILIYKCDRDDSRITGKDHHDHGIWAAIMLNSNRIVFLAGDCAYDTIAVRNVNAAELTNNGQGYDYLVASHHGGVYTHTQARNKTQYIPSPDPQTQPPQIIYSANGVAYGHPDPANVAAYGNAGWYPVYLQTLPGQGFNVYELI